MVQPLAGELSDNFVAAGMRRAVRPVARFAARNIRLTVLVSVVLICGSFAAATSLEMRIDRTHALAQAGAFETRRAQDIASLAASTLDRAARIGIYYARNPAAADAIVATEPGLANIAVYDRDGGLLAAVHPDGLKPLPPASFLGGRVVLPGLLTIPDGEHVVAVSFGPRALVPATILDRAALMLAGGRQLEAGTSWTGDAVARIPVPGWPLFVETQIDEKGALDAWYGALPLYLFVIVGPALVGAWLAALFVHEFERRARASEAIRTLKSARPVEARLLVRLANAERGAVEAARSKSEFIAHMSHELRTPLNAIIGFSEVIERGFFGPAGHPKYVEYAHDIAEAGRGLHAKIGDILEFANVEAGRYPIAPALLDLAELAGACVDEHRGLAFSRRIKLDIGLGVPSPVRVDPRAVQRILASLISNALSYTEAGGSVRVDVTATEGACVAAVRDSGSGFTDREKRSAGNAFARFDRPGTVTGAGLGLAIAVGLARRMGGAIRFASAPGEGTVMELRLPKP